MDKNIVVGVTGGIAIYKALDVISQLKKKGINVNVIMTKHAQEFIKPIIFQTISQNYVISDMFDEPKTWNVEHIELAKQSDLFLVVPASANIIGKIANGIADDMLTTTIMATKSDVVFVPSMNTNMYENAIVQKNMDNLKKLGYKFIEPASGLLACGDYGKGKLPEPSVIVENVINILNNKRNKDLKGKRILVTAGPTIEPIDPVRYITNHSSGKMGYAIAQKAFERGAQIILVSGPTNLSCAQGINKIDVKTTHDMYNVVIDKFKWADIIIKAAAVADYRPAKIASNKIKKGENDFEIKLTRNQDILKELGKVKGDKILVGFAAETQNLIDNAKTKITNKNLDFIVANDLTKEGSGFKGDTNIVSIIDKEGNINNYKKMTKHEIANVILDKVIQIGEE